MTQATRITEVKHEGGLTSYWLLAEQVYRLNEYEAVQFDIYGAPLGARWECSLPHFNQWRNVIVGEAA